MHNKHVCEKCGWHGVFKNLLTAPDPFNEGELLWACPSCKNMTVVWACDTPYCFRPVSSGTPTSKGYKNFCSDCYFEYEKKEAKA